MSKPVNKKSKTKKIILITLCIVLAVILTLMILAAVYIEKMFSKINRVDPTSPTLSSEQIAEVIGGDTKPEVVEGDGIVQTTPTETAEAIIGEKTCTFLLVGADKGGIRSDAMILCTVNKVTHTITLVSFQRDTYVTIPDYFPHKLNTAYSLGKFETLVNTLNYNFGVQIDGCVGVDFDSFPEVIDALGGVDMELTAEEADHLNYRYPSWTLTEGINHLTGTQALHYSRIRSIDGAGDLGRTNRQRMLLSKLFEQVKGLGITELNSLLTTVLPLVTTDLTNQEIINYGMEIFPILLDCTIESTQIPAEGTYHLDWVEQDGGMSIIEVDDWDSNIAILESIIGE